MNPTLPIAARGALCALALALGAPALAHDARVGAIEVGHPFATPSLAGTTNGAAYLATLSNTGPAPDKLVRASTAVAERVELHTMGVDAQGVMRMREIAAVELAPKASVKMRPGLGTHLMLIGLKQPLKEGATFAMTLEFERAGKLEVKVVVQVPRARDGAAPHKH